MIKRHLFGAAAVTVAGALVLSGCSAASDDSGDSTEFTAEATGTLNAWGFENADDVGQARLDHAAEKLADVDIEIDQTAFDAQKFTTLVASGKVPDVVQVERRFVGSYAAQGLIQPLTQCFDAHEVDADSTYYSWVVDDVRYKDDIWAVPQFYQPPAIITNTRVLDAAGVASEDIDTSDIDGLVDTIGKVYQESGGNPSVLGFDPVATGQPELWVLGQGGQLVDGDGAPTLDTPENAAAIENLKKITDAQGGYAKVKSFTDSFDTFGDNNQYVADQVGAQVNAQWYPNVLTSYADQIQISAVPFLDQDGNPFAVAGGSSFVVPVGAKNPSAGCAWALALTELDSWLAAAEARSATLEAKGATIFTGLFTANTEADNQIRDTYVKETGNAGFDETIATFYQAVEHGKSVGASPVGQEVHDELVNAITSTLLGDKSAADALADAQENVQRAYDKVAG